MVLQKSRAAELGRWRAIGSHSPPACIRPRLFCTRIDARLDRPIPLRLHENKDSEGRLHVRHNCGNCTQRSVWRRIVGRHSSGKSARHTTSGGLWDGADIGQCVSPACPISPLAPPAALRLDNRPVQSRSNSSRWMAICLARVGAGREAQACSVRAQRVPHSPGTPTSIVGRFQPPPIPVSLCAQEIGQFPRLAK